MSEREKKNKVSNESLNNAISYIPLWAIFIHFTVEDKNEKLKKHMKYGFIIFIWYLIINFILPSFFSGIFFIAYLSIVWCLAFRAYSGEEIKIDTIDDFEKKL